METHLLEFIFLLLFVGFIFLPLWAIYKMYKDQKEFEEYLINFDREVQEILDRDNHVFNACNNCKCSCSNRCICD